MASTKYFRVNGRPVIRHDQYKTTPADKTKLRQSARWKTLKARAIAYYHGCVVCGAQNSQVLRLHHRYYYPPPHPIDDYALEDVSVFCKKHHDHVHT